MSQRRAAQAPSGVLPESTAISRLRAGVIGTGFIGPVHVEALRRLGVQVTALCGSDRVAAAAARWGVPVAIAGHDHRALLARDDVDVVHIASPNRHHHAQALDALRAGKHVVCEKPLAMTSQETGQIARAAARSRLVFAVNYNVRFYPAVLQLRAAVARGDLGEIIHVNGSYLQDWLLEETDYNWRLLPAEGGILRAVADIGTHWLDAVSFVLDARVEEVFACLETYHRTRLRPLGEVQTFARASRRHRFARYRVRTEDFASILLRFSNGAHGNVAVSQVAAGRKNSIRIEIYGSKKSASWHAEEPNTIRYGRRGGPNEDSARATPGFADDVAGFTDYPAGHAEGFPDTFKMLYRAVYEAIAGGKPARPLYATAADGHQEAKVCEAILQSHRSRAWARVGAQQGD